MEKPSGCQICKNDDHTEQNYNFGDRNNKSTTSNRDKVAFLTESMGGNSEGSWVLDSGCTSHMINNSDSLNNVTCINPISSSAARQTQIRNTTALMSAEDLATHQFASDMQVTDVPRLTATSTSVDISPRSSRHLPTADISSIPGLSKMVPGWSRPARRESRKQTSLMMTVILMELQLEEIERCRDKKR
ncbi:hypothetical protein PR048_020974 [Dryococelus australis]|uniref:Uncharacterized protein n=1 Tax=Dryococelus australis TaxID=614101 RepID=A0ABQ9GWX9_9NEOP|nr:hypothetical protein PR048_020974 [Dryococelus australis]